MQAEPDGIASTAELPVLTGGCMSIAANETTNGEEAPAARARDLLKQMCMDHEA